LSSKLAMIAVPLFVAYAVAARADDEEAPPEEAPPEEAPPKSAAPAATNAPVDEGDGPYGDEFDGPAYSYPPPVDGPALRLPEPPTSIYFDGAYAVTNDLTVLPYIAGKAHNFRAALGGGWRWRRFTFDGQVLFHVTTIDVTSVLNMEPTMQDRHQTAASLGDTTVGATWTERLAGEALIAGLALRGRLATHTTRFDFHLADGSLAAFVIPYYFHIEPTLVVGGVLGPFRYVMNQGAIALVGPDGNFDEQHITVPSIYFWDAHYAISVKPWSSPLGASVELATMIQLNRVAPIEGQDVTKFNDIRAVWVAPALQLHMGATRIDAIARFGLSRGQEVYGALEYVGTHSFTVRLTRYFD